MNTYYYCVSKKGVRVCTVKGPWVHLPFQSLLFCRMATDGGGSWQHLTKEANLEACRKQSQITVICSIFYFPDNAPLDIITGLFHLTRSSKTRTISTLPHTIAYMWCDITKVWVQPKRLHQRNLKWFLWYTKWYAPHQTYMKRQIMSVSIFLSVLPSLHTITDRIFVLSPITELNHGPHHY